MAICKDNQNKLCFGFEDNYSSSVFRKFPSLEAIQRLKAEKDYSKYRRIVTDCEEVLAGLGKVPKLGLVVPS
jgi:hypothetical protein